MNGPYAMTQHFLSPACRVIERASRSRMSFPIRLIVVPDCWSNQFRVSTVTFGLVTLHVNAFRSRKVNLGNNEMAWVEVTRLANAAVHDVSIGMGVL